MENKYNLNYEIPKSKGLVRDELRRLQKAARDNDRKKLLEWGNQFEDQIRQEYENAFKKEVADAVDNFFVAIVYTLHFNEHTKFGPKRLNSFVDDLFVTIDLFRTKEYNPEEYKEQLRKDGIHIFDK